MRCVVFLDHLDAGAAVFGDLIDVRAFQQPEADVGVAKTVCRSPTALAVELQLVLTQDRIQLFLVVGREDPLTKTNGKDTSLDGQTNGAD